MKQKAWNPPTPAPSEPELIWRVVEEGDSLFLAVVNKGGVALPGNFVIEILPDGRLERCDDVISALGLPLDFAGRVKFAGED